MARFTFQAGDEYAIKLSRLSSGSEQIAKKAIYEAAKIVADRVRSNLEAIPTDKFRYLRDGDTYTGPTRQEKADMLASFGITPISLDDTGSWNAKLGFDGYGGMPTKKFPKGIPNQLIARATESGSSIRRKRPFVRPALNATKAQAQAAMERVIEEEIKKIMGK